MSKYFDMTKLLEIAEEAEKQKVSHKYGLARVRARRVMELKDADDDRAFVNEYKKNLDILDKFKFTEELEDYHYEQSDQDNASVSSHPTELDGFQSKVLEADTSAGPEHHKKREMYLHSSDGMKAYGCYVRISADTIVTALHVVEHSLVATGVKPKGKTPGFNYVGQTIPNLTLNLKGIVSGVVSYFHEGLDLCEVQVEPFGLVGVEVTPWVSVNTDIRVSVNSSHVNLACYGPGMFVCANDGRFQPGMSGTGAFSSGQLAAILVGGTADGKYAYWSAGRDRKIRDFDMLVMNVISHPANIPYAKKKRIGGRVTSDVYEALKDRAQLKYGRVPTRAEITLAVDDYLEIVNDLSGSERSSFQDEQLDIGYEQYEERSQSTRRSEISTMPDDYGYADPDFVVSRDFNDDDPENAYGGYAVSKGYARRFATTQGARYRDFSDPEPKLVFVEEEQKTQAEEEEEQPPPTVESTNPFDDLAVVMLTSIDPTNPFDTPPTPPSHPQPPTRDLVLNKLIEGGSLPSRRELAELQANEDVLRFKKEIDDYKNEGVKLSAPVILTDSEANNLKGIFKERAYYQKYARELARKKKYLEMKSVERLAREKEAERITRYLQATHEQMSKMQARLDELSKQKDF